MRNVLLLCTRWSYTVIVAEAAMLLDRIECETNSSQKLVGKEKKP